MISYTGNANTFRLIVASLLAIILLVQGLMFPLFHDAGVLSVSDAQHLMSIFGAIALLPMYLLVFESLSLFADGLALTDYGRYTRDLNTGILLAFAALQTLQIYLNWGGSVRLPLTLIWCMTAIGLIDAYADAIYSFLNQQRTPEETEL